MSNVPTPPPTRPGDISRTVPLAELADRYGEHAGALVCHRLGIGEPLTAEQQTAHALADLAYSHALAQRALAGRWCAVRDALAAGRADLAAVAAAMGLESLEVAAGLPSWADGQRSYGFIADAEHAAVVALVAGQGGAR